jgi:peptide deformylase
MAIRPLLTILDDTAESLKSPSLPVEDLNDELKDFIRDMFYIMRKHDGVGLAAPQVGRNIQVIVMDAVILTNDPKDIYVLINPKITKLSNEIYRAFEGCLSVKNIACAVERPYEIEIEYTNFEGEKVTNTFKDILARIIQHEIDHLNGVLMTSKSLQTVDISNQKEQQNG